MAKHFYIYSTLTDSVDYTVWSGGENGIPQAEHVVHVAGGTGVANRKTVVTPSGAVVTKVTEEQLDALNQVEVFKLHKANGYIEVRDSLEDGEAVASEMASRDGAAPLVPEDFTGNELQPIVGESVDVPPSADPAPARNPRKA